MFKVMKGMLSGAETACSPVTFRSSLRYGLTDLEGLVRGAEEFCRIASRFWPYYWVWRRVKFVRYPIGILDIFIEELDFGVEAENVIFTR